MDQIKKIYQGVLDGDMGAVEENVQAALNEGISPGDILNKGLIAAMGEVGRLFEEGEYFVPEMLIAARDEGRVDHPAAITGGFRG